MERRHGADLERRLGADARAPRRRETLRRVWRFCRYSFWFRAALTMALGVLASCGNCTTCLAFATYIGCQSCGDTSTSGCNGCSGGDGDGDGDADLPETEVECQDGVDDDGDGEVDCEDSDCRFAGLCGEYICYDGVDDDGDGATDCDDDDCCHLRQCRCHCETRCEAGTQLCISDAETCDAECCPAGEECVDGACTGCDAECAVGYVPCWTGEGQCGHVCCTPGQVCGGGGCECPTECADGTHACVIDEFTCEYECCAEGSVCRAGGCSPYACSDVVHVEEREHLLVLDWSELDDTLDVSSVEGCASGSGGEESLLQVDVPPGEALTVLVEEGELRGAHVLDDCPPESCRASTDDLPERTLLWINDTEDEQTLLVLLEGGGATTEGSLQVSRATGEACSSAIALGGFDGDLGWTAHVASFDRWTPSGLCDEEVQRRIWFEIEIEPGERLDVVAWGSGPGLSPRVIIAEGDCSEPRCVATGNDTTWIRNDLETARSLLLSVGWSERYEGDLNIELRREPQLP